MWTWLGDAVQPIRVGVLNLLYLFLTGGSLLYNSVLVSAIHQCKSDRLNTCPLLPVGFFNLLKPQERSIQRSNQ